LWAEGVHYAYMCCVDGAVRRRRWSARHVSMCVQFAAGVRGRRRAPFRATPTNSSILLLYSFKWESLIYILFSTSQSTLTNFLNFSYFYTVLSWTLFIGSTY